MVELVNTSLPNGLIAGTHGFATVAMTRGLADNLRRRLEDLSAYVHKTSAHDATYDTLNPVAWSHLILPRGEHVLGRVAAAPFDYTGRTNRLARLVCLAANESRPANAAETLLRENAYFSAPWEGEARWLEPDATLAVRFGAPPARVSRKPQAWIEAFGEADGSRYAAGFAALLRDAIRQNGRPLAFITSQQSDPDGRRALAFIADLIVLLPDDIRPYATFSTYPCAIPIGVKCAIRVLRKDDNGYAQAVAGVPVADFAAKTIQNANLLPRDAELEDLAATGSLPAPSAPTAQTKAAPQAAAPAPTAASASTDEAIDVSIDVPPTTEAGEAIAVTAKDASHRKPSLKHRPGPSAPLPGQRFDPFFGQPRKRGKGPLIAAVAAGVALILGLVAVLVLQSKPHGSISGGNASVQDAQEAEREKIKEQFEREKVAQAQRKAKEDKRRREIEEASKGVDESLHVAVHEPASSVGRKQSGETQQPLCQGINHISICTSDTQVKKDSKTGFGPRNEKQLTAVSVWYYSGNELKECKLNAKTGSGGDWYDAIPGFYTPEPKNETLPTNTPYCRIWRFDSKPDTLFWVTGNANGAQFDIRPPHNDTPINLAERFTGPDLRVLAQWEKRFGKVSCQAWTAEGANPAALIMIKDVSSFIPSDFIVQCFPKRKEALDKEYAEVLAKQPHLRDLQNQTNTLANAILAFEKAPPTLTTLSNNVAKTLKDYQIAEEKYKSVKKDFAETDRKHAAAVQRHATRKKSIELILNSKNSIERDELNKEIKKLETEVNNLEADLKKKKEEQEKAKSDMDARHNEYTAANNQLQTKNGELNSKKSELAKLVAEVDPILEAKRKVEAAQAAFPKSVEEAQRQWTIHVRVDLGGVKQ